MPLSIRADSTDYITATVTADHDISGATIDVAIPTAGVAPSTWYPAETVSTTSGSSGRWTSTYRLLVGPAGGATQLTPGNYDWTVRITDNPGPEVPVRKAGVLTVNPT